MSDQTKQNLYFKKVNHEKVCVEDCWRFGSPGEHRWQYLSHVMSVSVSGDRLYIEQGVRMITSNSSDLSRLDFPVGDEKKRGITWES